LQTTFQNEIKEFQIVQQLKREGNFKDTRFSNTQINEVDNLLNKWTLEEISFYGQIYYSEAIKIVSDMPRLPNKDDLELSLTGEVDQSDDRIMSGLTTYLNNLIKLSPLICTLLAFRNFLTDGS
jgi:hypothetical protein